LSELPVIENAGDILNKEEEIYRNFLLKKRKNRMTVPYPKWQRIKY
jgi:hypothetical protein